MSLGDPFGPSRFRAMNHEVYLGRFVQQGFRTEGDSQILDENGDVARFLKGIFGDDVNLKVANIKRTPVKADDHKPYYGADRYNSSQMRCQVCKCNAKECNFKGQTSSNSKITFTVSSKDHVFEISVVLPNDNTHRESFVFSEAESAPRRAIHFTAIPEAITAIRTHPDHDRLVAELKKNSSPTTPKQPVRVPTTAAPARPSPVAKATPARSPSVMPQGPKSLVVSIPDPVNQLFSSSGVRHSVSQSGHVVELLNNVFGEKFCEYGLMGITVEPAKEKVRTIKPDHHSYYEYSNPFDFSGRGRRRDSRPYCTMCRTYDCDNKGQRIDSTQDTPNNKVTMNFSWKGQEFTVSFEQAKDPKETDVSSGFEYRRTKIEINGPAYIVYAIEAFTARGEKIIPAPVAQADESKSVPKGNGRGKLEVFDHSTSRVPPPRPERIPAPTGRSTPAHLRGQLRRSY